jgi:hypothetical protein
MASVIQKNKALAETIGSSSISVTLNPLTAGSVIVLVAGLVDSTGSGAFSSANFRDQLGNTYTANALSTGTGPFGWTFYAVVSPAAGAETYTFNYTAISAASSFAFLAGIAAYEISGCQSVANATASSSVGGPAVGNVTATLSGLNEGADGNFIVAVGAFLTGSLTEAQGYGAGAGWTLDGSDAVSIGSDPVAILFESQLTTGNPTGVFSGSADTDEFDGTVGMVAVLLTSAIGGGGSGTGTGPLASNNPGDTLTNSQVNAIFSASVDLGHTCDGIVYGGTLAWEGEVGIIRPSTGLGDVLFPTIHAGESKTHCRALAADFTYSPNDGNRVKFIVVRTSAGDRLAKAISTL